MIYSDLTDDFRAFDREMRHALLLDPESFQSGRAARTYWILVSRCVVEAFSVIMTATNCNLLNDPNDHIAHTLQQAEEDIFRGVSSLAMLLADPNIQDDLMEQFQGDGIIHPWYSHLGFRMRSDPMLAPNTRRFISQQYRRGRSQAQFRQAMRLLLKQPSGQIRA